MLFCPNGSQWSDPDAAIWTSQRLGVSRCFYDTLAAGVTAGLMTVLGTLQCVPRMRRWRQKQRVKVNGVVQDGTTDCEGYSCQRVTGSGLHRLQCVLAFSLSVEALLHMILQDVYIQEDGLCGFNVVTMLLMVSSHLLAIVYLHRERTHLKMMMLLYRRSSCTSCSSFCWGLGPVVLWTWSLVREAGTALLCWNNPDWWWTVQSGADKVELGFWVTRMTCCTCLFMLSILVKIRVRAKHSTSPKKKGIKLFVFSSDMHDPDEEGDGKSGKEPSTWADMGKKIRIMAPLVWPSGHRPLQALVVICVGLLAAGRVVNVFVPLYNKKIVNSLTGEDSEHYPWQLIMIYCVLLYLRGAGSGGGLVPQIRQQLWISVQQYTSLRMNLKVFSHLHSLSHHWHLQRKTGEVLRVVEQGTSSMNTVLNQALFQIFPTLIDAVIAVVYFITAFNYLFGLIIFICVIIYIVLTLVMMEWRTRFRREMIRLDKEAKAKAVDSLLNFETVKYYGATEFEINNYKSALVGYQTAEWKSLTFLTVWQATQNTVTIIGYLAAMLLSAWAVMRSVSDVHLTLGDFVLLGTYLGQLFGPLNSLGLYYRILQRSFIDMEKMFELLETEEEVKDVVDAKGLQVKEGKIEFRNVSFFYEPSRPILRNISFTVNPGETLALVGHTGSGKSTIIRLLFRFYDVSSGTITIDGQDIAQVTQASLRNNIGVVPQDTVLFNRDIQYNIQYGRFNASDSDVEKAATAAEIHERILKFPSQYDTVVGERGLKLSGGEKQRVAIARTLLKAPAIVLLDEATSALDTKTERNIQTALAKVCENRTTIVIAHRLSTIVNADHILVLHEGAIVEQGTHQTLLSMGRHYASMWRHQLNHRHDETPPSPTDDDTAPWAYDEYDTTKTTEIDS